MIPKNIDSQAILAAIQYIDENGIPKTRLSRTYNVLYNGKLYPPKYLISIANRISNGHDLEPYEFGGGIETNGFLEKLGFKIIPFHSDGFVSEPSESDDMEVVTVVIGNQIGDSPDNEKRLSFMEDIVKENKSADIIVFPAGYFYFNYQNTIKIEKFFSRISSWLKSVDFSGIVCVGVDCDNGNDQLAVAVSQEGVQAIGRKFHPTPEEDGCIRAADSFNELEMGYSRVFKVKQRSIYLAICYDGFGIRHCNLPDLGIDVVLVLAHQFWNRGEGPSGDVDFARKGFAGASQYWKCPVFGTAVFFCRDIPENWPTGVLWTDQTKSVRYFKYHENKLKRNDKKEITGDYETALCYQYII